MYNKETRKKTQAAWYVLNRESIGQRKAESYKNRRALHLCWEAARRAKRKGITYTLTTEDVADIQKRIDAGFCELTRVAFSDNKPLRPSIDRIDSSKGYEIGNIRIVCHAVNCALGEWGEDVLRSIMVKWLSV